MATPTEKYSCEGELMMGLPVNAVDELYDYAVQLEEQLRAMTTAERLVHDDRDRLEGELAETRKALQWEREHRIEYSDASTSMIRGLEAERDEARQVAGQLLWLARAQYVHYRPGKWPAKDCPYCAGHLTALPPAVRRLVEGE